MTDSEHTKAALCSETLDLIEENRAAFDRIEASWRRHTPWGFRRQYQLCKANEPLFKSLGIEQPPFSFETSRSRNPGEWLVRRMLGV